MPLHAHGTHTAQASSFGTQRLRRKLAVCPAMHPGMRTAARTGARCTPATQGGLLLCPEELPPHRAKDWDLAKEIICCTGSFRPHLVLALERAQLRRRGRGLGSQVLHPVGIVPHTRGEEEAFARWHRYVVLGAATRAVEPEAQQALLFARLGEQRSLHTPAAALEGHLLLALEGDDLAAAPSRYEAGLVKRPHELLALADRRRLKVHKCVH